MELIVKGEWAVQNLDSQREQKNVWTMCLSMDMKHN